MDALQRKIHAYRTFQPPKNNLHQLPPKWFDRQDMPMISSTLRIKDFFMTQLIQYNFKLWMLGYTENLVSISLEVKEYTPFFFIDASGLQDVVNDIPNWLKKINRQINIYVHANIPEKEQPRGRFNKDDNEDDEFQDYITSAQNETRKQAVEFSFGKLMHLFKVRCPTMKHLKLAAHYFTTISKTRCFHQNSTLEEMFLMERSMRYFHWVKITSFESQQQIKIQPWFSHTLQKNTSCFIQGHVLWSNVIGDSLSRLPLDLIVLSFDLEQITKFECDKYKSGTIDKPHGKLTLFPNPDLSGDAICTIASVLNRQSEKMPYMNVIHHLKEAVIEIDTSKTLAPVCYSFESEKEMLIHWIRFVVETVDIDIFDGFNNIKFDLPTIYRRCVTLGIKDRIQLLNRFYPQVQAQESYKKSSNSIFYPQAHVSLIQGGGGGRRRFQNQKNNDVYIHIPGRQQIDAMLCAMKNEKQDKYSLKELADSFLKGMNKDDLAYEFLSCFFMSNDLKKRGFIHKYCLQDVLVAIELSRVRGYSSLIFCQANLTNTTLTDIMLKGSTKRTWHIMQTYMYENGWVFNHDTRDEIQKRLTRQTNVKKEQELMFQACLDKAPILKKRYEEDELELKNNSEKVRIKWKIDAEKELRKRADEKKQRQRMEQDIFKEIQIAAQKADDTDIIEFTGGLCLDVKKGPRSDPTTTLDFNSLYPNSMYSYNLDASAFLYTLPRDEYEYDLIRYVNVLKDTFQFDEETIHCILNEYIGVDSFDKLNHHLPDTRNEDCSVNTIAKTCKLDRGFVVDFILPFLNSDPIIPCRPIETHCVELASISYHFVLTYNGERPDSVVPNIVLFLVSKRKEAKKKMESYDGGKDPILYSLWDVVQTALKLIANSLYGSLASEYCPSFFLLVAIATCYMGRNAITRVMNHSNYYYGAPKDIQEQGCTTGLCTDKTSRLEIVGGDTDSYFSQFIEKQREDETVYEYWERAWRFFYFLEAEVNAQVPYLKMMNGSTMKLELEKTYCFMLSIAPKRYIGSKSFDFTPYPLDIENEEITKLWFERKKLMIKGQKLPEKDEQRIWESLKRKEEMLLRYRKSGPSAVNQKEYTLLYDWFKKSLLIRGVSSGRRDMCTYIRKGLLKSYVVLCMSNGNPDRVFEVYQEMCDALSNKKVALKDLSRTLSVKNQEDYKNPNCFQIHLFKKFEKRGILLVPKTRVECAKRMSIYKAEPDCQQWEDLDAFELNSKYKPDYSYYLNKQLKHSFVQLMGLLGQASRAESYVAQSLAKLNGDTNISKFMSFDDE